jgi:hypothetical protein
MYQSKLFGGRGTRISVLVTPITEIALRMVWPVAFVEGVTTTAGVPLADLAVDGLMFISKALSSMKMQFVLKSIDVFDYLSTHS